MTTASSWATPDPLPPHTPTCMGCGPDNPNGLHMRVFRSGQQVYADVVFDERHIGAPGLAHGGAIAAACDDLFGFTLWIAATPAVTRNLAIGYLLPVPLHQPHRITAHIAARAGRALQVAATGTDDDGVVRFTATARFIAVSVEHFPRTPISASSASSAKCSNGSPTTAATEW